MSPSNVIEKGLSLDSATRNLNDNNGLTIEHTEYIERVAKYIVGRWQKRFYLYLFP